VKNGTDQAIELGIAAGATSIILAAAAALVEREITILAAMLGGFGAGLAFACIVAALSRQHGPAAYDLSSTEVKLPAFSYSTAAGIGLGALISLHAVWIINSLPLQGSEGLWPIISTLVLLGTTFAAIKATASPRRGGNERQASSAEE